MSILRHVARLVTLLSLSSRTPMNGFDLANAQESGLPAFGFAERQKLA